MEDGAQNEPEAAKLADADCFVNISTDKAATPISVLGRSSGSVSASFRTR